MKKIFISLIFTTLAKLILANPIMTPPVISEMYWDQNGWEMELVFDESYGYMVNLDEVTLVYNEDTSAFVSGIPIVFGQPMVIDKNDLVNPFEILIDGGVIELLETATYYYIGYPLFFGNHECSNITPVTYGQSIVRQEFSVYGG